MQTDARNSKFIDQTIEMTHLSPLSGNFKKISLLVATSPSALLGTNGSIFSSFVEALEGIFAASAFI